MPDIALISELTHRSLQRQKDVYPAMPHFVIPDELDMALRPTQRSDELKIHAVSLAVLADNEKDFRDFLLAIKKRKAVLHIDEDNSILVPWHCDFDATVKDWKNARRNGAGKAGGKISAEMREAESRKACKAIETLWPLPNSEYTTPELLKMAGKVIGKKRLAYNTAIKFLGKRPIAQYNHLAKLKRKANAKPKN